REPVLPCPDRLQPQVRQNEIDCCRDGIGVGVEAQQFVWRAVGTGSVGAHAKAVGNRLELFLFLVDAVASAPPPRLMNKGSVRRIHQANDDVVHAARQIGGEVGG